MKLKKLLQSIKSQKVYCLKDSKISSVVDDSRKAVKNCLFVAVKGLKADGHNFVAEAIEKGTIAVVGERTPKISWLKNITYVKVKNSRNALAFLASAWYGNPSQKLKMIGVTGTKGKSTTAGFLYSFLKEMKFKVGIVSSISTKIGSKTFDTGLHVTNPEPLVLHKFLKKMFDEKCKYAILEVTSHGLDQERVGGINFEIGILTNVAHEHLDYHKTFNSYRKAKMQLFKNCKVAILNKDDGSYESFKKYVPKKSKVISCSINRDADYKAFNIIENNKLNFFVKAEGKMINFKSSLHGDYNVLNCVAAIAAARQLGLSWSAIKKTVKNLKLPKGRLERIKNNKGLNIYIDFAHTPDSLEKTLYYLRKISKGKLISVFGCAGERDVKKRSLMGEISTRIADISIFTAEDPRSENVNNIIKEIVKGTRKLNAKEIKYNCINESIHCNKEKSVFIKVVERGEAIAIALQKLAAKGDTVVICGKGHEISMAYNGIEYPWSDYQAVQIALKGGAKIIERKDTFKGKVLQRV